MVDEDHSVQSRKIEEMFDGIAATKTFRVIHYDSLPRALDGLRVSFVRGVVDIPHDFRAAVTQHDRPRLLFSKDNSDQFISGALLERLQQMTQNMKCAGVAPRLDQQVELNVVEIYPYIEYIDYCWPGPPPWAFSSPP